MKSYIYKLKDETGKNLYGFQKAKDLHALKKKLRESRYFFLSAQPVNHNHILDKKVPLESLIMFTRRLSALIESGIPILTAMHILWRQTEDKTMQLVICHIRENLEEGKKISIALNDFPNIFPVMYRAMIDVAEQAGGLVEVLKKLTSYLAQQRIVVMRTKKATLYPAIVLTFAFLVLIMLFTFVVPTFQRVLLKLNVELPLITKIILAISAFIRSWPFFLGLGIIVTVGIIVYLRLKKHPQFSYYVDSFKLKIPFIGYIYYLLSMSRFSHSFGLMMKSGLPIIDSFEISKTTTSNNKVVKGIDEVRGKVEQGETLYDSFKGNTMFPIILVEMVGVGEKSGRIVNVLENLAYHFDEEIEYRQNKLFTLFEPFLIIFVGLIVIVTLLAIYMPVFSIWRGLTG